MVEEKNMDTTKEFNWMDWITQDRHISQKVFAQAGLSVNYRTQELIIPIISINNEITFHKYRRAPWKNDGAKYRYDMGSSAALFGAEVLKNLRTDEEVVITEGELDALALRSMGYIAVSSTGGSKTWKEEWGELFEELCPIILYDADRAGIEGALKLASMMPTARIAWCPVAFGKDPTEVIHNGGEQALHVAIINAKRYDIPQEYSADYYNQAKNLIDMVLMPERQKLNAGRDSTPFHIDIVIQMLKDKMDKSMKETRYVRPKEIEDDVERAKTYPITELIAVRGGFASCVYHGETTASMKVYKNNHAFSFCCGKRSDVIDIYREINGCSFKEAITKLNI